MHFDVFESDAPQPFATRDADDDIKFDPPVGKQRYGKISNILEHQKWKGTLHKMVDFGCGSFNLFLFIKRDETIREVMFVDIEEFLLTDSLFKLQPILYDHFNPRSAELVLKVLVGSCTDPDSRLLNTDIVVAIELIEHLYPDVLDAFQYNLFAFIRPKLAVITTPNSDFNVLFPKRIGFRHYDHKFEWSRGQFESWANNLTTRFPHYVVSFCGVGCGPRGTDSYGCCTQLALFIRKDMISDSYVIENKCCTCTDKPCRNSTNENHLLLCSCTCQDCIPKTSYGICRYFSNTKRFTPHHHNRTSDHDDVFFELITEIKHPFQIDKRSDDEKIFDKIQYRISNYAHLADGSYCNYENNRAEIPLSHLINGIYGTDNGSITIQQLRELLTKFGYKIVECSSRSEDPEFCVIYDFEMSSDSHASDYSSDDDNNTNENVTTNTATGEEPNLRNDDSNWDIEDCETKSIGNTEEECCDDKLQEALFDSGYQKSVIDESPQSPTSCFKLNDDTNPIKLKTKSIFDKLDVPQTIARKRFNQVHPSSLPKIDIMDRYCDVLPASPVAGPSNRIDHRSPGDEEAKSIANCIVENSLNKIDVLDDYPEYIEQYEDGDDEPNEILEVVLVENGDLANNNRDYEGNNYQANVEPALNNVIDNLIANGDNNYEMINVDMLDDYVDDVADADLAVECSSREALCNSNSHIDLFDDYEMQNVVEIFAAPIDPLLSEDDGFPSWLLDMFVENEPVLDVGNDIDFFSHGDGIGLHPSVITLREDADAEDEDSSSASDSAESRQSDSYNLQPENSQQDVPELEDDDNAGSLVIIGQSMDSQNENQ